MTRRGRRQRDEEWTCKFSKLLRLVVESNNIKLDHLDSDAGILLSAFRTWVSGKICQVHRILICYCHSLLLGSVIHLDL